MDWRSTLFAVVILILSEFANATVVITTPSNESLPFSDMEAGFTPRIPQSGIMGLLYLSNPLNACEPLKNGPALDKSPYAAFVLIERGICQFDVKVKHAQDAGFSGAIVYNHEEGRSLVIMSGDSQGIQMPAVFVSKAAGLVLSKYAGDPSTRCYIFPTLDYPAWSVMAVAFISLLAVTGVLTTFFFVRRHRLRRLGSRLLLPSREPPGLTAAEVKALPTMMFKRTNIESGNTEICVICMEEYEHGQKLRILPCRHAFHATCVDQWLLTRKPFCPVCKRDAHLKTNDPSISESTPLLTARFPIPILSSAPAATQTSPTVSPSSSTSRSMPGSPIPATYGLHRSASLTSVPVPSTRTRTGVVTPSSWPRTQPEQLLG